MKERKKIVFATNNIHKLQEIRAIVGERLDILSLRDIDCFEELPETAPTIEGNARMKAKYVHDNYGVDCFADDTGLEVEALGGDPGVRTARYASESGHDTAGNMKLLLSNLEGETNRKARFVTVIVLISGGKEYIFDGICEGSIASTPVGEGGFGYDPVFVPDGMEKTFAQMKADEKNMISHRGRATRKLIEKLKQL